MLAKLLPIILLLVGTGGGIGAGLFLMPGPDANMQDGNQGSGDGDPAPMVDSQGNEIDPEATEFLKMSNQFVIPVVTKDAISSLVVVSLSLETSGGVSEEIYAREPKLRDAFLRVLFDHANMGGFQGAFTNAETLDLLRAALRRVAQKELGDKIVDVLILDILRQDT
ncbi:MAG: flagellar basal body-associated protein FliL [Rhodobacteraceae bacterium]|nr:flagellar basal body-associated protein FliL [Paracoccaceae bacterium]